MSRDLLLEIGAEELPASFVLHALASMKAQAEKLLAEARLGASGPLTVLGTPRRLALIIPGLAESQPDRRETVMGPPASAGVAPDGSFTGAALGFAKKQGATQDALRVVDTPKGKYVAVELDERGRPARDVLPGLLSTLCTRITFPKAMRWGEGDHAFGRPIHWIVALHGAEVVPFEFAGVTSGRSTRGHRFLASATFDLDVAGSYVGALRAAHVMVDFDERRRVMAERLGEAARELGGTLEHDAFLLDECLSLVEEPHVVPGTIEARFLDLPDAVIVSVMRTHQRYFAVRKPDGALSPTYLNVVNTALSPSTIARGNDRVLRARLNDAAFFVREDQKRGFVDGGRAAVLDRVVFQQKLGSVGAKVRRIEAVALRLASGVDVDAAAVARASRLAKLDLTTQIVGEFPELQGAMGRYYATAEGVEPTVADAIRDHYKPAGAEDTLPPSLVSALVAVADRIDTLVGCFGIGLVPTGSADPFALRRAALGIVRIATDGPLDVDARAVVELAFDAYERPERAADAVSFPKSRAELGASLEDFFRGRLRAYYRERFPGDVVDASLAAWSFGSLADLHSRVVALDGFRSSPDYASLAVAFKRAFNISKDVAPGPVDEARLEAGHEAGLAAAFARIRPELEACVARRDHGGALGMLGRELRAPIDAYFENVFVMVDDVALRENRLRLLRSIADTVQGIVHFHLLTP